jgi:hypothetical protein
MAIQKVELTVSQLINDLNEGLTWLKKDDLGYGSIEIKYGANEKQIATIRKHPALKDAETNITIFDIIDDTKNDDTSKKSTTTKSASAMEQPVAPVVSERAKVDSIETALEAADIFANL